MRIAVFAVAGLIIIGAIAAFFWQSAVPVQATAARRGTIREFVDERGRTRLDHTHVISMPFAARLEPITVEEGDRVKAGEVVAQVVPQDIADEVAQARAAVERLSARIVENDDATVENSVKEQAVLFVDSMKSTVDAAEARTLASKSQLDYAEAFLGRARDVFSRGASSRDLMDEAEVSYIQSQVDYRQNVLITEALRSLQSATSLLPRVISEYIARKVLSREVLEKERTEAEARLREALLRQQRGVMTSPVDGVVLERTLSNEQYVTPGTVLLRIGRLEELEVEAEVLSEDVVRIRAGDPVEIYGPALGASVGDGVPGSVVRVYPAGFTKLSSLGVEQQRVMVIVHFAEGVLAKVLDNHTLGVDYRVRVRVFTDESSRAILIPRSALFRGPDGRWQVFVIRDGKADRVRVSTGLMNDEFVEVKDGVTEGENVILAPESSLREGTRVHVEENGE